MKVLLIDNYDSFTYNLAQLLAQSGICSYAVKYNDRIDLAEVHTYDKILISPGPGLPAESGVTNEVIRQFGSSKAILGICLGHQAIAEVYGARLFQMDLVQHGQRVETSLYPDVEPLFSNIPNPCMTTLYHSWAVDPQSIPDTLMITATTASGQIMGIRHKDLDIRGLQFHPESYGTDHGMQFIRNWLTMPVRRSG